MYNYSDGKFLGSNSVSSYSLPIKKFGTYSRGGLIINNIGKLPVIKEEDGSSSEEELEINTKSLDDVSSCFSFPSVNINCLMNVDVKQSHSIWNTNFGRRLINENSVCEVSSQSDKEIPYVRKGNKKSEHSKPIVKTKFVRDRKIGKSKKELSQTATPKKKSKKVTKNNQNLVKKESTHEKQSLTTISKTVSSVKSSEISETVLSQETLTGSLNSKPQYLTEYVKSIFENNPEEFKCEHCDETFSDIDILCKHEKEHEIRKETCLLCEKVFYNLSNFTQHLLTHEGVDRYSCKKCMKYFPSLKKYEEHDEEVHRKPPPTVFISPPKLDLIEKWLPKFECKRCKIELDSAKTYEGHRRAHIRKDMARAYLLSVNNI